MNSDDDVRQKTGSTHGMTEPDEKLEKTETGYSLKIKSTRGTGTRDQDTVEMEAKAEKIETVMNQRKTMVEAIKETMNERREHQPDE